MSKSLLLMLCLVIGLLVLACAPSTDTNRNANAVAPANTSSTPATSATNANANTSTAAAGDIGIAECDTFLKAYDDCVSTKVPEAARATYRTSINTWRTEWKRLADNPQTRGTLVGVCKTQLETARTQLKSFNCTF